MIWAVRDTPQLAGDGRNRAAGDGGDLPEPVLLNIELTRDELIGGERWIRMIGTTCRTMRRWRATDRSSTADERLWTDELTRRSSANSI